jgi:chromosomal replication initiator protein
MGSWNYSVFWDEAMNQAKAELGDHEFAMWFNIQYESSTETSIAIRVPSSFYKDQLVRQYQKFLEDKLFDLMGKRIAIDFVVVKPTSSNSPAPSQASEGGATGTEPRPRAREKDAQP